MHEMGEVILSQLPLAYIVQYANIFAREQENGRKFVSAYSEDKWLKGQHALSIKEDLCEAIAEFSSGLDENIAFYKASPKRYEFVLDLISMYLTKEDSIKYTAGVARTRITESLGATSPSKERSNLEKRQIGVSAVSLTVEKK